MVTLPIFADGTILQTITDGTTEHLLIVVAVFLVGLGIIYWGFKTYRTGRLIRDTSTERTRSIAVGRTEVNGFCRDAGTTFNQPFSEGRCVYREWEVEVYKEDHSDDDNSKEWKTVDSGTDAAPFYIEDGVGQVLVSPNGDTNYQISDENSDTITVGGGSSLPDRVSAFYEHDEEERQKQAEKLNEEMGNMLGIPGMGGNHDGDESAFDPEQISQQYLPEEMLDENGKPREDLSDEEAERLMREHTEQMQSGDTENPIAGMPFGPSSGEQTTDQTGDSSMFGKAKNLFGTVSNGISALNSMGGRSTPSSRYKRRFSQEVLPVDEDVYVFGGAYERKNAAGSDTNRLEITTDKETGRFIVSDREEASLARYYTIRAPLYMLLGLVVSSGTLYVLLTDWVFV